MKQWFHVLIGVCLLCCCCASAGDESAAGPQRPELVVIGGHGSAISSLVFSPDGRKAIGVDAEDHRPGKTASMWDLDTGKRLCTLNAEPGLAPWMAFHPDGKQLVGIINLDDHDQWLAVAPGGYYDGSPGGCKLLARRVGNKVFPVTRYEKKHHRPDLVARALGGTSKELVDSSAPLQPSTGPEGRFQRRQEKTSSGSPNRQRSSGV